MAVQFITTPSGDEMAILPRAAFEALLEEFDDRIDNLTFDRAEARRAAGVEEGFPSELVDALCDGANPVRTFREYRRLTVLELAGRAGISGNYLSKIESGARKGTAITFNKLARALDVDLELLL